MSSVRSADGTAIAYDELGAGPPVILVGGAFSFRKYRRSVELAELLAEHFTVFNYDRRGRGDSGDTVPYSVEREIEDLAALIELAGSSVCVWGQSSGGVLALRAAASGLAIDKLAAFEPPFRLDVDGDPPPADFATRLDQLVAADRRDAAVRYFMTKGVGAPRFFISLMRLSPRLWSRLTAVAHTLPYDVAVMGDTTEGKPLSPSDWGSVRAETLVLSGAKSPERAGNAGRALADVLPNARHEALAGQSYNIKMKPMAPVLREFFSTHRHGQRATPGPPDRASGVNCALRDARGRHPANGWRPARVAVRSAAQRTACTGAVRSTRRGTPASPPRRIPSRR